MQEEKNKHNHVKGSTRVHDFNINRSLAQGMQPHYNQNTCPHFSRSSACKKIKIIINKFLQVVVQTVTRCINRETG